jgi:predicted nucleic acid-binding Zn ribbon protein
MILDQEMKRKGGVISLSKALHGLLRSWGLDGKIREHQTVDFWDQIVGPRIAEKTQSLRVEDGKMFVRVRTSSWKTELVFMKPDIIKRLNQAVGRKVIKDIIFVGSGEGSRR